MSESKKTKYLSYIEETRKHLPKLIKIVGEATSSAIEESLEDDVPVVYIEDGVIKKKYPDGRIEDIGAIAGERRVVIKGEQYVLSEG